MRRAFAVSEPGEFTLQGTLAANPLKPLTMLLTSPEIESVSASSVRALGAAGAPTAAFDLDPRTAWSPAPGDPAPRLSATFVSPVTVAEIRLRTRDGWTGRHAAVVRVTVDGQERFGRLAADGHLAFTPMTGRSISITVVREVSERDPVASLEVEEVGLAGVVRSKPPTEIAAECGDGPEILVNDVPFATRLLGTREAALGFGTMTWEACSPVGMGYLPVDTLDILEWGGMSPVAAVVTRVEGARGTPPVSAQGESTGVTDFARPSPSELEGRVSNGPRRVLVMNDNANPGWVAALDEVQLVSVTVDGFRQGFLLPEGVEGDLSIRFAPDTTYRLALSIGLILALLLLPLAHGSGRPSAPSAPARRHGSKAAGPLGAIVLGAVIAGAWGALVGLFVVGGLRIPAVRTRGAAVVAGLTVIAGLAEVLAEQAGLGAQALEVTTRILVLLAVAGVAATPTGLQAPRGSDS